MGYSWALNATGSLKMGPEATTMSSKLMTMWKVGQQRRRNNGDLQRVPRRPPQDSAGPGSLCLEGPQVCDTALMASLYCFHKQPRSTKTLAPVQGRKPGTEAGTPSLGPLASASIELRPGLQPCYVRMLHSCPGLSLRTGEQTQGGSGPTRRNAVSPLPAAL